MAEMTQQQLRSQPSRGQVSSRASQRGIQAFAQRQRQELQKKLQQKEIEQKDNLEKKIQSITDRIKQLSGSKGTRTSRRKAQAIRDGLRAEKQVLEQGLKQINEGRNLDINSLLKVAKTAGGQVEGQERKSIRQAVKQKEAFARAVKEGTGATLEQLTKALGSREKARQFVTGTAGITVKQFDKLPTVSKKILQAKGIRFDERTTVTTPSTTQSFSDFSQFTFAPQEDLQQMSFARPEDLRQQSLIPQTLAPKEKIKVDDRSKNLFEVDINRLQNISPLDLPTVGFGFGTDKPRIPTSSLDVRTKSELVSSATTEAIALGAGSFFSTQRSTINVTSPVFGTIITDPTTGKRILSTQEEVLLRSPQQTVQGTSRIVTSALFFTPTFLGGAIEKGFEGATKGAGTFQGKKETGILGAAIGVGGFAAERPIESTFVLAGGITQLYPKAEKGFSVFADDFIQSVKTPAPRGLGSDIGLISNKRGETKFIFRTDDIKKVDTVMTPTQARGEFSRLTRQEQINILKKAFKGDQNNIRVLTPTQIEKDIIKAKKFMRESGLNERQIESRIDELFGISRGGTIQQSQFVKPSTGTIKQDVVLKESQGTKLMFRPVQTQKVSQETSLKSDKIQKTIQAQAFISETLQAQKQQKLQKSLFKIKQDFKKKTKKEREDIKKGLAILKTVELTPTKTQLRTQRTITPTRNVFREEPKKPKKGKIKVPLPKAKLNTGISDTPSDKKLFEAFARLGGTDISIGEFATKLQAEKKLKKRLKTTLRASGFIEEEGLKIPFARLGFASSEFRAGKRESFRVVQRKSKRLGTRQETRQIQYFKNRKSRGGLL